MVVWWAAEQARPGELLDKYAVLGDKKYPYNCPRKEAHSMMDLCLLLQWQYPELSLRRVGKATGNTQI
jgi:hypothetical protein